MRLKRPMNQVRAQYLEGQRKREEESNEPLLIPVISFVLTLLIGSLIGYFSGLFFHQRPSSGILTGAAVASILFILVHLKRSKSVKVHSKR